MVNIRKIIKFDDRNTDTHHILLYSIHPVLEFISCRIHVGNHRSDVANDGGKDEDAYQEVDGDKSVPANQMLVGLWRVSLLLKENPLIA